MKKKNKKMIKHSEDHRTMIESNEDYGTTSSLDNIPNKTKKSLNLFKDKSQTKVMVITKMLS